MTEILPAINASLNAVSTILLLIGFKFIRAKQIEKHRRMMMSAFVISVIFLACYLLHKWLLFQATGSYNTAFQGQGVWRTVYFTVLISHVVLAACVPVLAIITIRRGLAMRIDPHRRIARITFPIWLYVSVTGVLVYFMLYHWFATS